MKLKNYIRGIYIFMIGLNDFFTEDSLNIFTDASMNKYGTSGCIGICLVFGKVDIRFPLLNIQTHTRVLKGCTNMFAEAEAVKEAVYIANHYKHQFRRIRIISDSQVSIDNIRDRIGKWKIQKSRGEQYGKFISSQGPVKNQDIFLDIMYFIVENNLEIEFLYQSSHTNFNQSTSLDNAKKGFIKHNHILDDIDMELIRALSLYNNYVDRNSRDIFYATDIMNIRTKFPFNYHINEDYDRSTYVKLVHPESIFNKK